MAEALNIAFDAIDSEHAEESATTRRRLVAGAAGAVGGMGLLLRPVGAASWPIPRRARSRSRRMQCSALLP